jgi:hypothetical protein
MADDGTDVTVVNPDDWKKSYLAKKGAGDVKVVSPDAWRASYQAKKAPQQQPWSETFKQAGQNVAVQGAGIAPIVAGAEGGALLGTAGGPFDPLTVPIGAMAGAGLGAMTSPTARYYMGKLVGSKQPEPTMAEANYEGKIGAATEGFGPIAGNIAGSASNAIVDSLVGKSELGQVGTDAAQATEQANLADKQKLQDAATTEATKQKTATAEAAEKQGQKNLAERADASQKALQKQESFERTHEQAKADANTDFQKAQGKLQEGIVPEARQETVAGTLGKTEEQTRASRFDPNFAQTEAAKRNIIIAKSNEAGNEFHKEYEDARGQFGDKPAKLTNTASKAAELEAAAAKNNWKLSPSTLKLLDESKGMASPKEAAPSPMALGFKPKQWRAMSPAEQQLILKNAGNLQSSVEGPGLRPGLVTVGRYSESGVAPQGASAPTGPTIGQAIGLNSKWGAAVGSSESYDGLVAKQMREALLSDLDNSGVPRLRELNNRYRAYRNGGLGDYDFLDKINNPKGGELHTVMEQIVGNPQRGTDFVKRLSPEEKVQFRDMYADYINTGGKINPDHAPILAGLGFKGPLTKPEAWVYADKQAKNLDEIFATSPNARVKLQQQIEVARSEALTNLRKEIIAQGYKDANALGPTGARIKAQMDAAKTDEDKSMIAVRAFNNLDPGQAAQDAAAGQQKPGMAGYQQGVLPAPRTARDAAQGFQPEDPQAAAVKAIQEHSPARGKWAGYLMRRAAFGAIGGGGYGAMTGRIPPMLIEGGIGAGAVLGREGIAAAWRSSIQSSPEAAAVFYRALQNPGTPAAMHTFAQSLVDGAIASQIAQHGQPPVEAPKPASKGPGPMVQHIEHEKAKTIAGPRGAVSPERVSRIEDLNKDIAAGSAPEVNADLRAGKLTHTDIAKMVQPDKPGLAGLFQGMSPQQAVDAFAMADPAERELALSALAQHIQNEGKNLQPQDRQRILSQLRTVLQPPQQGAEG